MTAKFDVCVIGAGVAGGAMAAYLADNGWRVVVVEKNLAEQDRIVGELLQPGGVELLEKMGLNKLLEGFDAQPIYGYGLFMNQQHFQVKYPSQNGKSYIGRGFKNGKFVQKIRKYLATHTNITLLEASVTNLVYVGERVVGIEYQRKQEETKHTVLACLTIVSDGMFSAFRPSLSANTKKVSSHFLGIVLKNCELPFAHHGHVILADPSPCLVYPISSEETRMLIDFAGHEAPRKSAELISYLRYTIGPQLPSSILPAFAEAIEDGKFKVMPNHLIPATPKRVEGAVLLGDSLNMRHPLTGGGMTAALTDVFHLGRLLLTATHANSTHCDKAVQNFYATRHLQNATINILADALYGVINHTTLKQSCFTYLQQGGKKAEEPVAILSAVSRSRTMLIRHFFSVAVFGMLKNLKTQPNLTGWRNARQMWHDALTIVSPLMMNEKPNVVLRYALLAAKSMF